MNFAELRFWGLLACGVSVILLVRLFVAKARPVSLDRYDRIALLLLGWFMLMAVSWLTFAIFLAVKITTYFGLKWIVSRHSGRRRFLIILIPLVMAPLFYYKYANFVANGVIGWNFESLRDIIIPVGISFYTFQAVAFLVDTLAFHQPIPRFLDFMNFASFFPQIVAGPIERRSDLLPQMEKFRFRWVVEDINEGVSWIAAGLFLKMCLADNFAAHFNAGSVTNPFLIWLANLVFGLRIYYDFAGYSLVAFGIARCIGVRLTLNFRSPYASTSITEFWRRWHVTLSQWFRDYVYVPLGGNRTRWWWLNVLVVFVLSGVWHGAGWNFVFWGALNGVFLIAHRLSGRDWKMPSALGWALTMFGTFFAWLCFYETRTGPLLQKIQSVLNPAAYNAANLAEARGVLHSAQTVVLGGFLVFAVITLLLEWRSVARTDEPYCWLRRPAVLCVLVALTVILAPARHNAFIYFAF